MKHTTIKQGVLATLVALCSMSFAGARITQPVVITDYGGGYKTASGAIGAARNSADANQYIMCEVYGYETWSSVYCYAKNELGQIASCYTRESEEMKKAAYALSYGSYVSFQTSTIDYARCSGINVRTSSRNEPPQL